MIIQSTPFRAVWGFENEIIVRGYSVGATIIVQSAPTFQEAKAEITLTYEEWDALVGKVEAARVRVTGEGS